MEPSAFDTNMLLAENEALRSRIAALETEGAATAEALGRAKERFRLLLAHSADIADVRDFVDDSVIRYGDSSNALGEYPASFLDGWSTAVHPDDIAGVLEAVRRHVEAREPFDVESGGARFTIFFPTCEEAADHVEPDAAVIHVRRDPKSLTILVVDDEKTPRDMTASMLESLGHRVVRANGGKQAIRLFSQNRDRVDLVLLDVMMPKMDGAETLLHLIDVDPEVRVIFFSGYSEELALPEYADQPAKGFLKKPLTLEELARAIRAGMGK